jgi:cytosine deaminase
MTVDSRNLPDASRFVLGGATVPAVTVKGPTLAAKEGLASVDIIIADGRIAAIMPAGSAPSDLPALDMRDGMIWPCFTDMHTHLDKGHILPRRSNPDGTFDGALAATALDREAHWSAEDLHRRMEFSLKSAYVHGTRLIRTHLDSMPPQYLVSFELLDDLRESWKDRIALQAVALFPLDMVFDEPYFTDLLKILCRRQGLLGGIPAMGPDLGAQLDRLFRAASDCGLDVDLHVDETADPEAQTLRAVADAVRRNGFEGTVVVGHCCSLARQSDDTARATIEAVAEAGLAVVSLPMCNLYLQDRQAGRTPRWRGVTLFRELAAAGVRTAVSSDNSRDPFYAYGDLDPVEVFREAVRVLHLDHPFDDAARIVTISPADILGRPDLSCIAVGLPADLVLFSARRWSEFLSRPQADCVVLRNGRAIDRCLPDYRDLDIVGGG